MTADPRRTASTATHPEVDTPAAVVAAWLAAVNAQDAERLVALSDPDVAIVGPRGTARGAAVLRDWLARAGARLDTRSMFARDHRVVVAQHAVWRAPAGSGTPGGDRGALLGEAEVASRFVVAAGRVVEVERHDGPGAFEAALAQADLTVDDRT